MLADPLHFKPQDYQAIRRHAFKFCYQQEINQELAFSQTTLDQFIEHFEIEETYKDFLAQFVNIIFKHLPKSDKLIEKYAKNWKLYRIAKVDLSIMRVAIAELLERTTTDPAIIISDALNIAQEYASQNSPQFLNGILDPISKEVRISPNENNTPHVEGV